VEVVPAEALTVINAKCEIKGNVRQHSNTRSSYPNCFSFDTKSAGVLYLRYHISPQTEVLGLFRPKYWVFFATVRIDQLMPIREGGPA
jgi:hypothetical protein